MGTPEYANVILQELIKNFEVLLVITQPDKPVGRKKTLTPPPVKTTALNNHIKIIQPQNINTKENIQEIISCNADFIIVAAYGQILKKEILKITPCINLHASILPYYRGASPIQESILNNDKFAGVSAMMMEEGLDCGDVIGYSFIENKEKNIKELTQILSLLAAKLTTKVIKNFDSLKPQKQNHSLSSYVKKISKENGKISFCKDSAKTIEAKFRAFYEWPGIFLENGLKLKEVKLHNQQYQQNCGTICEITKDFVVVKCKSDALKIFTLQPPSKKQMSANAYILGKRLKVGDIFS